MKTLFKKIPLNNTKQILNKYSHSEDHFIINFIKF